LLPAAVNDPQDDVSSPAFSAYRRQARAAECLDDALAVANDTTYGLSLALYTRDLRTAFRAIEELEAGIVYVNAPTIGAEIQLPFGGIKSTGNGHREAGRAALELASRVMASIQEHAERVQLEAVSSQEKTTR